MIGVYAAGVLAHADAARGSALERPPARARRRRDRARSGLDAAPARMRARGARASIGRFGCCAAASAACRWRSAPGGRRSSFPPSPTLGGRPAAGRAAARAGARRPARLPDAVAGVGRVRDLLVPSRGVVGGAAAAHRARARLRRSRDRRRAPRRATMPGICSRSRTRVGRRRRAGARGQHGAAASQLEGRLLAALDDARNRRVPAVRAARWPPAAAAIVLFADRGHARRRRHGCGRRSRSRACRVDLRRRRRRTSRASSRDEPSGLAAESEPRRPSVRAAAGALGHRAGQPARAPGKSVRPRSKAPCTCGCRSSTRPRARTCRFEQLEGLTAAQLTGAGGPVQFRLRRDAGTFTFEGVLRNGVGAGTFSFAADPNFPPSWRSAASRGPRRASSTRWRGTTSGSRLSTS